MRRLAVLTSGGDAAGMNAAIRAVVRVGADRQFQVFGVQYGYTGLIAGDLFPLGARDVGGIIGKGGTMLGTTRCAQIRTDAGQVAAVQQLRRHDIEALVVIGGNGSQAAAHAVSQRGVAVIGIGSTIDNDLPGSEPSLGFTTAVDIALEAIDRLRTTAASHNRVFLVEVMGRDSGHLALAAGIAGGAEALVIPERQCQPEAVAQEIRAAYERGKSHAIVVVAEGAKYNAEQLAKYFRDHSERLGFELRITTLGHTQRGGAPGLFDRMLASELGAAAIEHLLAGCSGVLLGRVSGTIAATPLSQVVGARKVLQPAHLELAARLAQ